MILFLTVSEIRPLIVGNFLLKIAAKPPQIKTWLLWQCLNCRGVEPSNCFLNPLNTLSNYVQGVSAVYYIHTIYTIILVGLRPSKSLTPPRLIFHNSNTVTIDSLLEFASALFNGTIFVPHTTYCLATMHPRQTTTDNRQTTDDNRTTWARRLINGRL